MSARFWQRSIRLRLTLWYSVLVALLFALLVGVQLLSQHLSSRDFFQDRLSAAVEEVIPMLSLGPDGPVMEGELSDEDVHVTLLDASGALCFGHNDFGIAPQEARLRSSDRRMGGAWYLWDRSVALGGETYWVRCYISSTAALRSVRTLLLALLACMPVLLLLTLIGGNLIAKRALRPLAEIAATAQSISSSDDLNKRIRLDGQTSEIDRLASAFNRMLERLERSMEREKRFISDASHELRTPISVISAQSEFALGSDRSIEEKDAALAVIRERSERAGRMLNQMLLLTRMDARRLSLRRERLNLSQLCEGLCDELRSAATERNIQLRCDAVPGVQLNGDELLLTRMLTNLIQNAIQYANPGGNIHVTLAEEGARALLCVRDDGPGIPEQDQPRIWDRFYQVNKCAGGGQGAGLGLPIVRWIVEAHGGTITLESAPEQGSAFTVELTKA